jgi:hypothetical protein
MIVKIFSKIITLTLPNCLKFSPFHFRFLPAPQRFMSLTSSLSIAAQMDRGLMIILPPVPRPPPPPAATIGKLVVVVVVRGQAREGV